MRPFLKPICIVASMLLLGSASPGPAVSHQLQTNIGPEAARQPHVLKQLKRLTPARVR